MACTGTSLSLHHICRPTDKHTDMWLHTYLHIHTYARTHTYIHTYIHTSSSSSGDTTAPCVFRSSAPAHTRLFCLWRNMPSFSLLISLHHLTSQMSIYFLTSFGSHSHGIPFRKLPSCFCFSHPVKMSPPFYHLCSYVFNYIFSSH